MTFKPLLAETVDFNIDTAVESLSKLTFPLYASPKLDGVRALIRDGKVLSRKLIEIPNRHVQKLFGRPDLFGCDGELIVGNETDPEVFNRTTSAVMREDGEPDVVFRVFDRWDCPGETYVERNNRITAAAAACPNVHVVTQTYIKTAMELVAYESDTVARGYEGVMIRRPSSPYKYGRSTLKEGYLLKIKRFADGEAEVIGAEEQMTNNNEKQRDELGHAKRSSHKENLVGAGVLGALLVRDLVTKVEFSIGTGFDAATRKKLWEMHQLGMLEGLIAKYRHQPVGAKDKPRFPSYLGFRDARDMS